MSSQLCLLGYPLTYSWSPVLQQAAFDYYALTLSYELLPTPPHELCSVVTTMRKPEILGFNVTNPLKQEVMLLLDDINPIAKTTGAVNTVVNTCGKLIGYNTDVTGAMDVLSELGASGRITIVGAGGAARAVLVAISKLSLSADIAVLNRGRDRLNALDSFLQGINLEAECVALQEQRASQLLNTSELIINAATDSSILTAQTLSGRIWDLNYGQKSEPLRKYCHTKGLQYSDGSDLLVYQGADAFELWTGLTAPRDAMIQAVRRAL